MLVSRHSSLTVDSFPLLDDHTHPRDFVIDLDTRSLSIAMAVNNGMLTLDHLHELDSSLKQSQFNQSFGNMGFYLDPRYPDMSPLVCFVLDHIDEVYFPEPVQECTIAFGQSYAIPVFDHLGKSLNHAEECVCDDETNDFLDPLNECNIFRLLAGFLFWNNSSLHDHPFDPALAFIKKYAMAYPADLHSLLEFANHDAFPLLYSVSHVGNNTSDNETANATASNSSSSSSSSGSSGQRQRRRGLSSSSANATASLYEFCTLDAFGACSVLVFTSYDLYPTSSRFVSPNFYSMPTGSCRDTITPTAAAWDHLVEQPFATLTQQYQICTKDPSIALFEDVGIAMGNMSVLAPFLFYFIMAVIAVWSCRDECKDSDEKKTYSSTQKHRATNSLATALLLSRDEQLPDDKAWKKAGSGRHPSGKSLDVPVTVLTAESMEAGEDSTPGPYLPDLLARDLGK